VPTEEEEEDEDVRRLQVNTVIMIITITVAVAVTITITSADPNASPIYLNHSSCSAHLVLLSHYNNTVTLTLSH
jgi:hypothetical protein